MATKKQFLTVLSAAGGPLTKAELEAKIGQPYREWQTQMKRAIEAKLVEEADGSFVITDKGHEELLEDDIEQEKNIPGGAGAGSGGDEHSEESLGATEFQLFMKYGRMTGVVPMSLIKQTADHIWNGGDYKDLKWVAQGLQEMGIRQDLRTRWFHSWRSYLKSPVPQDVPAEFFRGESKADEKKAETDRKEGAGKRDYILTEDFRPQYVGEGMGDLDQKDAIELAKIRASRGKTEERAGTPGSMAEEITKMFAAFKEIMGGQAQGKSYVIKPGVDGYQVEEVDGDKPMLVPQPAAPKAGPSYYVDSDGGVKEVPPGQPVIIIREQPKPVAQGGTQYLIDKSTGEMREVSGNQPVVIIRDAAPAASQTTPIQIKDKDGNPMVLDLATYLKLDDHKEKQERDRETHQTKLDIAKEFKNLLKNAQSALSRMGEDET